DRLEATRLRELAHETQHRLMAPVHAVVRADGDDRTSLGSAQLVEVGDDLHRSHPAAASTTAGTIWSSRRSYTARSSSPGPTRAKGPAPADCDWSAPKGRPNPTSCALGSSTRSGSRSRMASTNDSTAASGLATT